MKHYKACSTCKFYPWCRILLAINQIDYKEDFIKHDSITKHERIAGICKYFKEGSK